MVTCRSCPARPSLVRTTRRRCDRELERGPRLRWATAHSGRGRTRRQEGLYTRRPSCAVVLGPRGRSRRWRGPGSRCPAQAACSVGAGHAPRCRLIAKVASRQPMLVSGRPSSAWRRLPHRPSKPPPSRRDRRRRAGSELAASPSAQSSHPRGGDERPQTSIRSRIDPLSAPSPARTGQAGREPHDEVADLP